MIGIVIYNVAMILLGVTVRIGLVPATTVEGMLAWLHGIIGITPPSTESARTIATFWIISMIVIVDGLLFFFLFLTRHLITT